MESNYFDLSVSILSTL
jgi:hypothetical protein